MTISKERLDELLGGVEKPEDFFGDKGLMKELKVRLMERMLGAELTKHLGYEPHAEATSQQSNHRNDSTRKVLKGHEGAVPIDIPHDRDGSFEPELVKKGQTRIDGVDDKIIRCLAGDCLQSLSIRIGQVSILFHFRPSRSHTFASTIIA